jgi:D-serine ammonia-lyase
VDHPDHIKLLDGVDEALWPGSIPAWINIDVGYHREGVIVHSAQFKDLAESLKKSTRAHIAGMYTHMGASYNASNPKEALNYMSMELKGLESAAKAFLKIIEPNIENSQGKANIILSLGATPTTTAVQNLLEDNDDDDFKRYIAMIGQIKDKFQIELHAGVHPLLDMQQLATSARPRELASGPGLEVLGFSKIGLRILAEVASVYTDRGDKPEALIAAGSLALGREPCKSYPGWGVVSPWPNQSKPHYDPAGSRTGWIVGRISQEHGILTWEGAKDEMRELTIGEKLLLWPNHACIASAHFGWYLVVDSDTPEPDVIRDVWVRWRGW